jgi:hypothetical protein
MEGIFEGGAAVVGLEAVSFAIGQETRAACAIVYYIDGNKESTLAQLSVIFSRDLNTYYYNKQRRFEKELESIHIRQVCWNKGCRIF